ncbi:hypothetical protein BZB76_4906 [Actinomadura pelletieri DSM 43383]|uniref:Uncharacterized protein n=1 Tax=Actinomadura pelletieri DSM 43383 TaxID=1120940 RepID=A0A495QIY7_9ACTN|nr:hypothetical protein [Actinomadura pelletieri]RKS72091.1 hypothetical protein BZB76_4906 [Actinomadura pelletieri DSM 43383]
MSAPVKKGPVVRVDGTSKGTEREGRKHVERLPAQTAEVRAAHPEVRVEEGRGDGRPVTRPGPWPPRRSVLDTGAPGEHAVS